jgi:SAM-dependent methyltransferase
VSPSTDGARERWDALADTFDEEPDHGLRDPDVRATWSAYLDLWLPAAPAKVLDLGCGTGSLSILLAEKGFEVCAVDVSPRMLEHARQKASEHHADVAYHEMDAAAPAFAAASFDVVLARHVVWALPGPSGALGRWLALLRPRGRLVLIEGRWRTDRGCLGLEAATLDALLRDRVRSIEVARLPDPNLWGRPVDDERYVLVAHA